MKNPTFQNNNFMASGGSRNKQSLGHPFGVKVLPSFITSCTPGPAVTKTGAGEKM